MNKKKWLVLVLLAVALPAQAEVYKCVADGKTAYQDWPCDGEAPDRSLTIIGKLDESSHNEPIIGRLNRRKAEAISNAIMQNNHALKESTARRHRINQAIVARRLTNDMPEADARLIYGATRFVERDIGGCHKLVWRNPDHAARVCFSTVAHVYY